MRILIDLEVERDEIPKSVELFREIRKFADSVRIRTGPKLLAELIPRLANPNDAEATISEIQLVLESSTNVDEMSNALLGAFVQHALAIDLVPQGGATLHFFALLPRLPEAYRKVKNDVITKIVQFLNLSRAIDCNRQDIITYADAFATLVKLDFVKIQGAISMINVLLKKPETKCAAVTMLGKTVELCLSQIKEKCDPAPLNELRAILQSPGMSTEFAYDVSYVEGCLGWPRRTDPFSPPTAGGSPNMMTSASMGHIVNGHPGTASNFNSSALPRTYSNGTMAASVPTSNYPTPSPVYNGTNLNPSSYGSSTLHTPSPNAPAIASPKSTTTPLTQPSFPTMAASAQPLHTHLAANPPQPTQSVPSPAPASSSMGMRSLSSQTTTSTSYAGLTSPPSKPSTNLQGKQVVRLAQRYIGHSNTIYAVVYDQINDNLITTGKEGAIMVWGKDGKQIQRIGIPRHSACAMDVNQRFRSLYVCGTPKDENSSPCLLRYSINDKNCWALSGTAEKKSCKVFTSVKALRADKEQFITGESDKVRSDVGFVRLYEYSQSSSFDNIVPVINYDEHKDLVTSLAIHPNFDDNFFSGSKDFAIKMWDRRSRKAAATLGSLIGTKLAAHEGMVTCLDAQEHLLASGGLDKIVKLWDLRAISGSGNTLPMQTYQVDGNALLKVVIRPDTYSLATSTLRGLYTVNISTSAVEPVDASASDKPPGRYHDLKWHTSKALYAVGDDYQVHTYVLDA